MALTQEQQAELAQDSRFRTICFQKFMNQANSANKFQVPVEDTHQYFVKAYAFGQQLTKMDNATRSTYVTNNASIMAGKKPIRDSAQVVNGVIDIDSIPPIAYDLAQPSVLEAFGGISGRDVGELVDNWMIHPEGYLCRWSASIILQKMDSIAQNGVQIKCNINENYQIDGQASVSLVFADFIGVKFGATNSTTLVAAMNKYYGIPIESPA